jgi:hypothetical protein
VFEEPAATYELVKLGPSQRRARLEGVDDVEHRPARSVVEDRIVVEGDLILQTPVHFGNGDGVNDFYRNDFAFEWFAGILWTLAVPYTFQVLGEAFVDVPGRHPAREVADEGVVARGRRGESRPHEPDEPREDPPSR